jgi:Family of unknown function (DUF5681)
MSDTTITAGRDAEITAPKQRGVPFKPGQSGNPAGRPKGARSRFSSAFIHDLASIWEARGIEVLEKCATEEPGTFLKVCASLMPKDIVVTGNVDLGVNPQDLLASFRTAVAALGNDPERLLRPMKVINARK